MKHRKRDDVEWYLPPECWAIIFGFLELKDLNRVCLVCKLWKQIACSTSPPAWTGLMWTSEKLIHCLDQGIPDRVKWTLTRTPRMFPATDNYIQKLTQCTHIKRLNITARELGVVGLSQISQFSQAESITLRGLSDTFTDTILMSLSRCKRLRKLTLCSATDITDAGVVYFLKNSQSLESLWVSCARISDSTLEHIPPKLTKLSLIQWPCLTDKSLEIIGRKNSLRHLEIGSLNVTDSGIQNILKMTSLQRFQVRTCSCICSSVYGRESGDRPLLKIK